MMKGVGCQRATREMWKGSTHSRARGPGSLQPGLMMAGPSLAMMTGLFGDVFLPSGQIAVGPSGAFL